MYLEGQHVDNGWIRSTFTLTHRVSWEQMLQAIYAAFDYFTEIVIFVDEKKHRITSRDEVLSIPESWNVSIAGTSLVFKVPMIIFFYNQVQFSNVRLRCVSEDLRGLTYEQFNKMVGPLMNALELAMFQEPVTPSQAKETAQSPVRQDTGAPTNASQKPGGTPASYDRLGPMFEAIAGTYDGVPCCTYIGANGAGHFVKMVHNGIEYADMQVIAEAYTLLREGLGATPAEIADIFAAWNEGELNSYLMEITVEVLRQVDAETGTPLVDLIVDAASQKGTGKWTVQTALDLAVPVTAIGEATFARGASSEPAQRTAGVSRIVRAIAMAPSSR